MNYITYIYGVIYKISSTKVILNRTSIYVNSYVGAAL